ncbi:condensation domain-containing protein [Nocardia sp. NPDC050435]|uniref:condensation domain-containing protein n=1 Tax=Nocardia sp. NPDC050435 TaxID=3155040 RepID=UPI00340F21A4
MSAAQTEVWLGQQLNPGDSNYNTADYVLIEGAIDPRRFEAALRVAINEAEALHARFELVDGRPGQWIEPPDWQLADLDFSGESDPWSAALAWMHRDVRVAADLRMGPLFAQALLRLAEDRWIWHQRIHHIAIDGYGVSLLVKRVAQLYTDESAGKPFDPFQRVLDTEASYKESGQRSADQEFWCQYLAGLPEPPSLAARQAPVAGSVLRVDTSIPREQARQLGELAVAVGVSRTELLIAATAGYVHRATGAGEVVLGLPVMNRLGGQLLWVPALVMNIVPIRLRVEPSASLVSLAADVTSQLKVISRHHRYRHEHIRRDEKAARGRTRTFGPVVNVIPFDDEFRFGPHCGRVSNLSAGPVEDFAIGFRGSGRSEIGVEFEANPDCYCESDIQRHRDLLMRLLGRSIDEPYRPLGRIPLADRPEQRRSVGMRAIDVVAAIRKHVTDSPTAIALQQRGRSMTYSELMTRAELLAKLLRSRGAGPGVLVELRMRRSPEAIVAILAVLISGAGYLPVSPDGFPERTAGAQISIGDGLVLDGRAGAHRPPRRSVRDSDVAYLIYTSGSSGRPHGVLISRGALAHFAQAATERYGVTSNDRVLQFAPLQFDASVEEIFITLCAGATLVLRTDEMTESLTEFSRAVAEESITVLDLPTAFWHELVAAGRRLPDAVRTVIIGGEAALPGLVARWSRITPGVRLINSYGPTEATVAATAADLVGPVDEYVAIPAGGSNDD